MAESSMRIESPALVDLLDRVVDRGVMISGDVVIALAGVDLIRLDVRALLVGVQTAIERRAEPS
jgi:hypothetical protein